MAQEVRAMVAAVDMEMAIQAAAASGVEVVEAAALATEVAKEEAAAVVEVAMAMAAEVATALAKEPAGEAEVVTEMVRREARTAAGQAVLMGVASVAVAEVASDGDGGCHGGAEGGCEVVKAPRVVAAVAARAAPVGRTLYDIAMVAETIGPGSGCDA